jgi:hypothetical protein
MASFIAAHAFWPAPGPGRKPRPVARISMTGNNGAAIAACHGDKAHRTREEPARVHPAGSGDSGQRASAGHGQTVAGDEARLDRLRGTGPGYLSGQEVRAAGAAAIWGAGG